MSKLSQLWLIGIIFFGVWALTGLGIGWWIVGPDMEVWLHGLLSRLIPLGFLSVLGAFGVSAFILKHYSYLRENGPDAGFVRELGKGYVLLFAFWLIMNQVLNGWPGKIAHYMGIAVTISVGLGVGVVVVFLATLLGEVIYRWHNR